MNTILSHQGQRAALLAGITCLAVALSGCERAAEPQSSLEVASRNVRAGTLSSAGDAALIGSSRHGGSFWSLANQQRLYNWNHESDTFTALTVTDLSPEGNWGVTSDGQSLVLWNVTSGEAEHFRSSPSKVLDVALGPRGEHAMLGLNNQRAVLYNLKAGQMIRRFAHDGPVTSVSFSADGRYALTGAEDGYAMLWDTADGRALAYREYPGEVHLVRLSPDGQRALSASQYDGAHVWDAQSESAWRIPHNEERLKRGLRITAARFSEDGRYLLTGRSGGLVSLWDLQERALMYTWRLPKRDTLYSVTPRVVDVAFTADLDLYRALTSNGFVHDLTY